MSHAEEIALAVLRDRLFSDTDGAIGYAHKGDERRIHVYDGMFDARDLAERIAAALGVQVQGDGA